MDRSIQKGESLILLPRGTHYARSRGTRTDSFIFDLDQCPLCLGPIEHLIHNIRSAKDYSTHYLLPLHTITGSNSASTSNPLPPARNSRRPPPTSTLPRHALYGRARLLQNQTDSPSWREREEEIALERRKYVYREGLYAKHVASNRYTGFKPFTPQTFANNPDMKAKVIKFIRREVGFSIHFCHSCNERLTQSSVVL